MQNVFFEHIWDYFGNILPSDWVFLYFTRNLKNFYHINETQEYFSYRSNFWCYITQHFNCISWKYEFLLKFSICCKKLHYFVVLWASFGFLCVSFGFLWVSFGFLWVIGRTLLSITAILSFVRLSSLISTCLHSIYSFIIDFTFNIFSDISISLKDTKKFPPLIWRYWSYLFSKGSLWSLDARTKSKLSKKIRSSARAAWHRTVRTNAEAFWVESGKLLRNLMYVRSAIL